MKSLLNIDDLSESLRLVDASIHCGKMSSDSSIGFNDEKPMDRAF
ncbi:hypothetical protein [Vibrio sp. 99-8-1]|nr:hypothetical protein [Vibrio sp. 99-8-1]